MPAATMINPRTGRRVLVRGAIGRALTKARSKIKRATYPHNKRRNRRSYHERGSVKTTSHTKRTASGGRRPSARALYNLGLPLGGRLFYDGVEHVLARRPNSGSPYWRVV